MAIKKERPTAEAFLEILKNDGYSYAVTSKESEPIDINFPNLPDWHKEPAYDEWRSEMLPHSKIICFEYNGSTFKLRVNNGDPESHDGMFGALYDESNEKIVDLKSTGDMETTIESLKDGDRDLDNDFSTKLEPYLSVFEIVLDKKTEFEYLIFKHLAENDFLHDLSLIDDRYGDDSDYED
ncbi:uncharacterized protein LOC116351596 [Contarinia nasturtii]|uniref:uncharacterized protein LOC116351596 n=1 Tax=Contarinia nasturtii TaxID=265458 RepID=UPI0012D3CB1A|nr:uncharacterized protein LOC116351596 [Contarinia nasturtii]